MTLRRLSTKVARCALLGVERRGWSRRSRLRRTGRARCARDRGGGVAVARGGDGREAAARGDGARRRGVPRRPGAPGVAGRGRARPRGGAATGPAPNLREGGRGRDPETRPPSQRALEPVGGLRATTGGGVAAEASRVSSRRRDALGSSSDESITAGPRRVPARVSPHEPRAGRRRALALVECGVSAEDAHVHDVLRHGRRASPPPRPRRRPRVREHGRRDGKTLTPTAPSPRTSRFGE